MEDVAQHLDPATGFLIIDVITILGAGLLGIQVDGNATPWELLETHVLEGALINWNNSHWTALRRESHGTIWLHSNSVQGEGRRYGQMRCDQTGTVRAILEDISQACGAATLHRVRRVAVQDGAHLLERESFRAMAAREEHEWGHAQRGPPLRTRGRRR